MAAIRTTSRLNSAAFTLVEMLIAMLIMTVGLLGLLQSVNAAYRQSLRDRVRNEAVLVAEEQMHDWRRMSFDAITATNPRVAEVSKIMGGVSRRFKVTNWVEDVGSSSLSKPTKKLGVSVEWDIKGQSTSHEIYTLKNR